MTQSLEEARRLATLIVNGGEGGPFGGLAGEQKIVGWANELAEMVLAIFPVAPRESFLAQVTRELEYLANLSIDQWRDVRLTHPELLERLRIAVRMTDTHIVWRAT